MRKFSKKTHNPIELINSFWPDANTDHIVFDPKLTIGEFKIIRQSGGDGTLTFTIELLQKSLIGIVNMTSYFVGSEPDDWDKIESIKYTVGKIYHATVYGMIELRCSKDKKYPGQRERVTMAVKCEYVYKNPEVKQK